MKTISKNSVSVEFFGRHVMITDIHTGRNHSKSGLDYITAQIHLPHTVIDYLEWVDEEEILVMETERNMMEHFSPELDAFANDQELDYGELLDRINLALAPFAEKYSMSEAEANSKLKPLGFVLTRMPDGWYTVNRLDEMGEIHSWIAKVETPAKAVIKASQELEEERRRDLRRNIHPDVRLFRASLHRLGMTQIDFAEATGYNKSSISRMLRDGAIPKWVWLVFKGLEKEKNEMNTTHKQ